MLRRRSPRRYSRRPKVSLGSSPGRVMEYSVLSASGRQRSDRDSVTGHSSGSTSAEAERETLRCAPHRPKRSKAVRVCTVSSSLPQRGGVKDAAARPSPLPGTARRRVFSHCSPVSRSRQRTTARTCGAVKCPVLDTVSVTGSGPPFPQDRPAVRDADSRFRTRRASRISASASRTLPSRMPPDTLPAPSTHAASHSSSQRTNRIRFRAMVRCGRAGAPPSAAPPAHRRRRSR